MKKTLLLIAVIFAIYFSSCSVGRIKNLEMKPNRAIIVGKLNFIKCDSTYLPNEWGISWNYSPRYFANCDSNGYIYMTLPVKNNSITNFYFWKEELKIFPNLYSVELKDSKIYYIGDITMSWDSIKDIANILIKQENAYGIAGMGGVLGGAIGGAIAGGIAGSTINNNSKYMHNSVTVVDNYLETTNYFKKLFPTDKIIEKALLKIKLDTINPNKN